MRDVFSSTSFWLAPSPHRSDARIQRPAIVAVSSCLTCTCSGDPISVCIVLLHLGLTGIFLLKGLGSNPKGIVSHIQHLSSLHLDFEDFEIFLSFMAVTVATRMLRYEGSFECSG